MRVNCPRARTINALNSWVAFFFSPRKRSFTNPNFSFITANTCSTFERTLDFVRFFARSTSSTPILVAVAPMGAVLGLRRALPDHFALSAISLIAPHPRFFAVQQIGQYHRIGYVRRRRHRRVDDLRLAIYSHVRLHPEVPLFPLLRLVHLRIALLLPVLGRSGCV